MNEALDALVIVAWGRLNDGLITDEQLMTICDALEALREKPEELIA